MTSPRDPKPPHSSSGPADLNEKRREVLRSLSRGTQVAEEVLSENERLLVALSELEAENARLRSAVGADDAIRSLLSKIEELEAEKVRLLGRAEKAQDRHGAFAESVRELESSLNDLANLYVAAQSIHSTLSLRGTLRRLGEILEQLVGIQAYIVYLGTPGGALRAVSSHGLAPGERERLASVPEHVHEVARHGRSSVDDQRNASEGTLDQPAALFPLSIEDQRLGVLSIVRSFSHKPALSDIDFQLFRFLGQHAAIALVSAGLYVSGGSQLPPMDVFDYLES